MKVSLDLLQGNTAILKNLLGLLYKFSDTYLNITAGLVKQISTLLVIKFDLVLYFLEKVVIPKYTC